MKTVQKYWVLSLFMMAGLIFAGCGDTASDGGGSTPAEETPASTDEGSGGGDAEESNEAPGNASNETGNSDFQLVSLNVPHMT